MVVRLKPVLQLLQGYLAASGHFASTSIGEPKDAPGNTHGAVMLAAYSIPATTLNRTIERREVSIRVYINAMREPVEEIEFDLDTIVGDIMEDLCGDFSLGGTVRNIDATAVVTRFGYQTISGMMYRLADITLPLIVDDSAAFVA
ncbi:MAG TPA: hypothetical protein VJ253_03185 [Dehalococcoidia bacterium]|nr:hypothetical protein [Dehalococcoidia bacterium]